MSALPPKADIDRRPQADIPIQLVRVGKLVFLGNSLERLGSALNPIGQTFVAFDRSGRTIVCTITPAVAAIRKS